MTSRARRNADTTRPHTLQDMVCVFCGCMCDDLSVTVDDNRVTKVQGACREGQAVMLSFGEADEPACRIGEQESSLADGVARAVELLQSAKRPLIEGLKNVTCEAQRAAASIADRCGALIGPDSVAAQASMQALQQVGQSTCTWGEVANRADLVVFWAVDPVATHPRHLERYSLEPRGEFVPHGRADRTCVVVHDRKTATARRADVALRIRPESHFESLWVLRALARGVALDSSDVELSTGVPLVQWHELYSRLVAARYGVVFYGDDLTGPPHGKQKCEALFSLVRDLNAHARLSCCALPIAPGNLAGAENVLAWRTGYPSAVDFSRSYPRNAFRDCESDASAWEGDLRILLDRDFLRVEALGEGDESPDYSSATAVTFRTSTFGISSQGTVYRPDDVALPLRPMLQSKYPSHEEVLLAIDRRLQTAADNSLAANPRS